MHGHVPTGKEDEAQDDGVGHSAEHRFPPVGTQDRFREPSLTATIGSSHLCLKVQCEVLAPAHEGCRMAAAERPERRTRW